MSPFLAASGVPVCCGQTRRHCGIHHPLHCLLALFEVLAGEVLLLVGEALVHVGEVLVLVDEVFAVVGAVGAVGIGAAQEPRRAPEQSSNT